MHDNDLSRQTFCLPMIQNYNLKKIFQVMKSSNKQQLTASFFLNNWCSPLSKSSLWLHHILDIFIPFGSEQWNLLLLSDHRYLPILSFFWLKFSSLGHRECCTRESAIFHYNKKQYFSVKKFRKNHSNKYI